MTEMGVSDAILSSGRAPRILADDVYWTVRRDIIRGALRPNEPLVESDIAERLDVSRTPVRESMQRLAVDGLIVSRRRRWYVREHTREEIVEIYQARAALEGYAARLAAERASEDRLRIVRECHASLRATTEDDGPAQVELNDRFHDVIVEASGNCRLAALIRSNRLFHFNFRIASFYSTHDIETWQREHDRISEAVCTRDGGAAEDLSREHIDHALIFILDKVH